MNRQIVLPNESVCPVAVEFLALLLRSDDVRVAHEMGGLPPLQRAALAGFCFSRSHMRSLGLKIAVHCDVRSLRIAAGPACETLIEHSLHPAAFDVGPRLPDRSNVSLLRLAA